jgi:quercetin dioxygenase-like cupin family protein
MQAAQLAFIVAAGLSLAGPVQQKSHALILAPNDGEHRVRRPQPAAIASFSGAYIMKVDRLNGGSDDFVMFAENIAPGQSIAPHHHPNSEEILFIHRGTGRAWLNGRESKLMAGSTIFMPRNTHVRLTNDGAEPIALVAIFSRHGFDDYLRDISVPEGEIAKPLTVNELQAIRARHRRAVVYEMPQPRP